MAEKLIPFQIKAILTKQFATIESVYQENEEVSISTSFNFGLDQDHHSVAVFFDLTYECNQTPFVILKIQMEFEVQLEAFKKLKQKKSNSITIPKGFLTHLSAMTVSTARGILHEKLNGSDFDFLLLPALNVSEIVKDDVKFDI